MEHAIFISKIKDLKYVSGEFSRLYFGIEFCQNLIPDKEELIDIIRYALERKMKFTFVTPFLTNEGMRKVQMWLDYLIDTYPMSEIVINDWGLLRWLHQRNAKVDLVLGRLLTKQKRGPRILNLINKIPHFAVDHFRQSNVDSIEVSDFLISKGIKRIELDNLLQGINRPAHSLKGSLYVPFAYITTTRFCRMMRIGTKITQPLREVSPCNKECQRYSFKLKHKHMPVDLFLKGNTQFFKNDIIPKNIENLNIDRLVYQPEMPL